MIIDIEGIDGSGKKVQSEKLLSTLTARGYNCKLMSFPNYDSRSSEPVKMYLNGELGENNSLNGYQASTLFAVDRLINMRKITPRDYDFIIMDRYTPSNMIHQSTRLDSLTEVDEFLDWVADFEYGKLKLPAPDITIFLSLPFETSKKLREGRGELKNGQKKDVLEQDEKHLLKAHERANYVAKKFNWTIINCVDENGNLKSIDEIHDIILTKLKLK